MLQPEQLAEIHLAVERLFRRPRHALGDQLVEPVVFHLHFQLFVEIVGDRLLDPLEFGRGPGLRSVGFRNLGFQSLGMFVVHRCTHG